MMRIALKKAAVTGTPQAAADCVDSLSPLRADQHQTADKSGRPKPEVESGHSGNGPSVHSRHLALPSLANSPNVGSRLATSFSSNLRAAMTA